jgi:hypothetical protein
MQVLQVGANTQTAPSPYVFECAIELPTHRPAYPPITSGIKSKPSVFGFFLVSFGFGLFCVFVFCAAVFARVFEQKQLLEILDSGETSELAANQIFLVMRELHDRFRSTRYTHCFPILLEETISPGIGHSESNARPNHHGAGHSNNDNQADDHVLHYTHECLDWIMLLLNKMIDAISKAQVQRLNNLTKLLEFADTVLEHELVLWSQQQQQQQQQLTGDGDTAMTDAVASGNGDENDPMHSDALPLASATTAAAAADTESAFSTTQGSHAASSNHSSLGRRKAATVVTSYAETKSRSSSKNAATASTNASGDGQHPNVRVMVQPPHSIAPLIWQQRGVLPSDPFATLPTGAGTVEASRAVRDFVRLVFRIINSRMVKKGEEEGGGSEEEVSEWDQQPQLVPAKMAIMRLLDVFVRSAPLSRSVFVDLLCEEEVGYGLLDHDAARLFFFASGFGDGTNNNTNNISHLQKHQRDGATTVVNVPVLVPASASATSIIKAIMCDRLLCSHFDPKTVTAPFTNNETERLTLLRQPLSLSKIISVHLALRPLPVRPAAGSVGLYDSQSPYGKRSWLVYLTLVVQLLDSYPSFDHSRKQQQIMGIMPSSSSPSPSLVVDADSDSDGAQLHEKAVTAIDALRQDLDKKLLSKKTVQSNVLKARARALFCQLEALLFNTLESL